MQEDMNSTEVIHYLRDLGSRITDNYFYVSIMKVDPIPHTVDPVTKKKYFKKSDVDKWFEKRRR